MASTRPKRRKPAKRRRARPAAQRSPSRRRVRRKGSRQNRYWRYVADAGAFSLLGLIGLAALFAFIARDLPDTSALWRDSSGPKVTILTADGAPLAVHGASVGAPIRLADLPAHATDAILAMEDRNFHHHFGVNPVSVTRAAIVNIRSGGVVQGGSTITQQLAKNVFLTPERTFKRKAQELLLAFWLEHKFTKDEILTLYLNRAYFGAGAHGIDAASYRYFGKSARYLTLGESAILAGLLKAPSRLAPTSNPEDAGRRGRLVIEKMVDAGFLTRADADAVIAKPILLSGDRFSAAPYFIDHVMAELRRTVGAPDADLIVRTTFDRRLQDAAETGFDAGIALAGAPVARAQGALVMIDGTGAVRAMIGGRDYAASQFNRATQARRQPGSAFKPFVYLAAMQQGAAPNARVDDSPIRIGRYAPDNYKSKFYGEVSLRQAMALSLNAATLRVQEAIGRGAVREAAHAVGYPRELNAGPALALGVDAVAPIELAGVYAPFANGGFRVKPHVIASVTTRDGDILYQHTAHYEGEAASLGAIDAVNAMMADVVSWGTGKAARIPGYAAFGKTGTTQSNRDAWFAGHAGGLVCVVWLGHDDNTPMPGVTGGGAPAVIWREAMARALPPRYVAPLQGFVEPATR
ncbi:MAG: PBP1A family penicillin-binding protein [Pseudomonadota bacterium]